LTISCCARAAGRRARVATARKETIFGVGKEWMSRVLATAVVGEGVVCRLEMIPLREKEGEN